MDTKWRRPCAIGAAGSLFCWKLLCIPPFTACRTTTYISSYEELVGSGGNAPITILSPPERPTIKKILAEYLTAQEGIQAILKSCTEKGSPE
mgnify:CR=1 FL=1